MKQTQPSNGNESQKFTPACDVFENDSAFLVVLDMPGSNEKELKLRADANELMLETARYQRSFRLPREIQTDAIRAEYKNGVMQITLPKQGPVAREIPVTRAN